MLKPDEAVLAQLLPASAGRPGSHAWWREVGQNGAPVLMGLAGGLVRVTFLWRDPQGDEHHSPIRQVLIDVNSLTDHHSAEPQGLAHLAGTDLWYWSVKLPADWRGSYAFIPLTAAQSAPLAVADPQQTRLAQRRWWRALMAQAQGDPLNPLACRRSAWGAEFSILQLPQAPDQSAWRALDHGLASVPPAERLRLLDWHSTLLGKRRRVWLFSTAGALAGGDPQRPLVLLLDGQNWALHMPIYSALETQTRRDRLPPALYVLIESLDGLQRERDLACSAVFWQAIEEELLVLLAGLADFTACAQRTVVAGQSLGGLAAMYAGWQRPQRFARILSQSGSLWWPQVELLDHAPDQPCSRKPGSRGWLTEQVAMASPAATRLRIFQEVGSREDVMIDVNDSHAAALRMAGHDLHYQIFQGGHDGLCWRGGLLDGLAWLLAE